MDIDMTQFFQVFFQECAEHLAEMERIFLSIDLQNPDAEELDAVFRAAHSIKGGAGTFGFSDMTVMTHAVETLLDNVRHGKLVLTREMVEVFLEAGDAIEMQLAGHRDGADVALAKVEEVCGKLSAIGEGGAIRCAGTAPVVSMPEPAQTGAATFYRIVFTPQANFFSRAVPMNLLFEELAGIGETTTIAHVAASDSFKKYDPERCLTSWEVWLVTERSLEDIRDFFMFFADDEELIVEVAATDIPAEGSTVTANAEPETAGPLLPDRPVAAAEGLRKGRRFSDRDELPQGTSGRKHSDAHDASSIRVGVSKVDQLINQMGELVITQAMLAQTAQRFDPVMNEDLHRGMALLERNTRDLQESVMSIRMMPLSFIFSRFPRLVHDLAAKLGKQAELKLMGEATELDKGLIEKLADPLTHLVRNSLDHGIETPVERMAAGKLPGGTVTLSAAQTGGRIVIEVSDDGAGLNRKKILKKAADKGLPVAEEMSDDEVWQLVFAPGFSTAEEVTDVSGRGVGMDVVMKNVQSMGGRVAILSGEGAGSRVVISLPLTLAILDGLSVRVGEEVFIVPLNSILESLQLGPESVNQVGGNTTVRVRDAYLPLLKVADVYGIAKAKERPEEAIVVIVDAEGEHVALLVDELLNQHQVVIKSLEANYRRVHGTAGATILGDGRVALILDVADLVHLWRKS